MALPNVYPATTTENKQQYKMFKILSEAAHQWVPVVRGVVPRESRDQTLRVSTGIETAGVGCSSSVGWALLAVIMWRCKGVAFHRGLIPGQNMEGSRR